MTSINQEGFARKIVEYHLNPERSQEWFHPVVTLELDDGSVQSTLCIPYEEKTTLDGRVSSWVKERGITFGYTIKLVMQLLERAYSGLLDKPEIQTYAKAVSESLQQFAQPFPDDESTMCYPHFLLHGIMQPTLDDVVGKINANARIIHETLAARDGVMREYEQIAQEGNLKLMMVPGCTDDYFGIAQVLAKQDAILVSSASNYIAKASFFMDTTKHEIYVMTLQGRRWGCGNRKLDAAPLGIQKKLEVEKEYGKIGNILGMGPRRFIIDKVMDFGRWHGFERIKVIRPQEHPMFIEEHEGFFANYEPVVRKAGITTENDCYLEAVL